MRGVAPTAAKEANHILSDSHLLIQLAERQDVFEGEISFFIADPLHLPEMIKKVEDISTIDCNNHILVDNDFQYSKIAGELSKYSRTGIYIDCSCFCFKPNCSYADIDHENKRTHTGGRNTTCVRQNKIRNHWAVYNRNSNLDCLRDSFSRLF